jgi:hypothetical protein
MLYKPISVEGICCQLYWLSTGSHFCNFLFHEDSCVLVCVLWWWACIVWCCYGDMILHMYCVMLLWCHDPAHVLCGVAMVTWSCTCIVWCCYGDMILHMYCVMLPWCHDPAYPAALYHIPACWNLHSVTVRCSKLVFCFSFQTSLALKMANLYWVKKRKRKVCYTERVISYVDAHTRCSKTSVHVVWGGRAGNVTV